MPCSWRGRGGSISLGCWSQEFIAPRPQVLEKPLGVRGKPPGLRLRLHLIQQKKCGGQLLCPQGSSSRESKITSLCDADTSQRATHWTSGLAETPSLPPLHNSPLPRVQSHPLLCLFPPSSAQLFPGSPRQAGMGSTLSRRHPLGRRTGTLPEIHVSPPQCHSCWLMRRRQKPLSQLGLQKAG